MKKYGKGWYIFDQTMIPITSEDQKKDYDASMTNLVELL